MLFYSTCKHHAIVESSWQTTQEKASDVLHRTVLVRQRKRANETSKNNMMDPIANFQIVEREHVVEMHRNDKVERNNRVVALASVVRIFQSSHLFVFVLFVLSYKFKI